jgi:hypothetical protein
MASAMSRLSAALREARRTRQRPRPRSRLPRRDGARGPGARPRRLEAILGCAVDLVPLGDLKDEIREQVEAEKVRLCLATKSRTCFWKGPSQIAVVADRLIGGEVSDIVILHFDAEHAIVAQAVDAELPASVEAVRHLRRRRRLRAPHEPSRSVKGVKGRAVFSKILRTRCGLNRPPNHVSAGQRPESG